MVTGNSLEAAVSAASVYFWGAQAASLQVSTACRDRAIPMLPQNHGCYDLVGSAAGNYSMAAGAPQIAAAPRLLYGGTAILLYTRLREFERSALVADGLAHETGVGF